MMKAKRFWTEAAVTEADEGFGVALDDRPVMTPGKLQLIVPTRAAAQMIADEWNAVEAEIDPRRMPTLRWANSALERVRPQRDAVVSMLAEYGGTDLLCYRADAPEGLVARQAAAWDGPLAWARDTLDAPLIVTSGVQPVIQPEPTLQRLHDAVDAFDPFELTAVHDLVVTSGSLVLALAVSHDALDAETAWAASRVDETWQAEQWGADEEAESLATLKRADFLQAERVLRSLRQ